MNLSEQIREEPKTLFTIMLNNDNHFEAQEILFTSKFFLISKGVMYPSNEIMIMKIFDLNESGQKFLNEAKFILKA